MHEESGILVITTSDSWYDKDIDETVQNRRQHATAAKVVWHLQNVDLIV